MWVDQLTSNFPKGFLEIKLKNLEVILFNYTMLLFFCFFFAAFILEIFATFWQQSIQH